MRITGGKYRSRVLCGFEGDAVRPTSDRTRESLFQILRERIKGASVLDLFAGSGAVGIEALSHGARTATFTDARKESVELVKKNLAILNERGTVVFCDALSFLERTEEKYDFIFLDPPYKSDLGEKALALILKRRILADDGVCVFETENPALSDTGLWLFDERKYGRANLYFYGYRKPACVFAGTFDPVTRGHEAVIEHAKNEFEKVYVGLLVNEHKTPLFSLTDRLGFLSALYEGDSRVETSYYEGRVADFLRLKNTPYYVRGVRNDEDSAYEEKNAAIVRKENPDVCYVFYKATKDERQISSSHVRDALENGEPLKKYLSKTVEPLVRKAWAARKKEEG